VTHLTLSSHCRRGIADKALTFGKHRRCAPRFTVIAGLVCNDARNEIAFLCANFGRAVTEQSAVVQPGTGNLLRYAKETGCDTSKITVNCAYNLLGARYLGWVWSKPSCHKGDCLLEQPPVRTAKHGRADTNAPADRSFRSFLRVTESKCMQNMTKGSKTAIKCTY
jgi:hypothetical protein